VGEKDGVGKAAVSEKEKEMLLLPQRSAKKKRALARYSKGKNPKRRLELE